MPPCEHKRHAGSTPATSTILPFNYGVCRPLKALLSDCCQKIEYPIGSGIFIKQIQNASYEKKYNTSYQVYIPEIFTGKTRVRKQFKSLLLAKDYAELTVRGQKKFGEAFFNIEPKVLFKEQQKVSVKLSDVIDIILGIKKDLLLKGTLRPRTEKSFRSLSRNINKYFKDTLISEISVEDIKIWINSLLVSRRTKLNNLNALREILNFSESRGFISKNPSNYITNIDIKECLGVAPQNEPDILTVEQTQLALKVAKKEVKLGLLPAITLGLFCGLRTEELKRLTWDDINLEEGFLTVSASVAKKRRIRNVTIPTNAIEILTPFFKKGEGVSPNSYCSEFEKKIRRLKKSSGLYWGSNALRHSFGSYHYALYGDSLLTSREMGHRNGDDVLFTYYRKLVSRKQSIEYFNIK